MTSFLKLLILGILSGWLASYLLQTRQSNWLNYMLIGVLGSFIGRYIFNFCGISTTNIIGTFIMMLCGAAALLWLMKRIK
jgi:uncharacterized membrane protein YeaQ/YmgE (transglycosylase-associated protein family)